MAWADMPGHGARPPQALLGRARYQAGAAAQGPSGSAGGRPAQHLRRGAAGARQRRRCRGQGEGLRW